MEDRNSYATLGTIHVLHVDDDLATLEVSKQILMDLCGNFEIDFACCADEALEKLTTKTFEAIVSDYEMPQKNGLDFLKELREKNIDLPFILFTGKGREEVAITALNLGADGYYNKQGSPETVYGELAHGIKTAIQKNRAIKALVESEKRYRNLMEQASEGILIHDLQGNIIDANKQTCKSLGYTKEELLSLNAASIDPQADPNINGEIIWPIILAGQNVIFQTYHTRKDQTKIPVEVSLNPIEIDNKKHILVLIRDNTERKQTEAALKKSETQYRFLAESSRDVIWTMDLDGKFTYVSPSVLQLRGYTPKEVMQQSITEALTPESLQIISEGIQHFKETGTMPSYYFELQQPCKDGTTVWTEVNFTIIWNKDRKPESILGVSRDITKRKKIEEALQASEERFSKIFKNGPNAMVITRLSDGKIIEANNSITNLTGHLPEEVIGKTTIELGIWANTDERENLVKDLLAQGSIHSQDITLKKKDGTLIIVNTSASIITVQNEQCLIASFNDVTKHKQAQEELKQAYELLEKVGDGIDAGLAVIDKNYQVVWANKTIKQIGITKDKKCFQIFAKSETICPDCGVKKIFEQNIDIDIHEYRAINSKGETFWVELRVTPLKDKNGTTIGAFELAIPINKRKKAEEELERAAYEQEVLLECAHPVLSNQDFTVTAKNIFDSCKKLIGATAGDVALLSKDGSEKEVLFLDTDGLACTVNPNLPMPIRGLRETAYQTGKVVYENQFTTSNWSKFLPPGHVKLSNVMLIPLVVGNKTVGLIGLANKPADFTERDAKLAASFGNYAVIALNNSWSINIIQSREKRLNKATKLLKASNQKLKTTNEKLQVVGSLTRHDVRNKLSAIKAYTYLLKKQNKDNPDLISKLEAIDLAVNQSNRLFEFSYLYEKIGAEQLTQVDVAESFNQATTLMPNLPVEVTNKTKGLKVLADSMLKQLFYNLIDNSLKHGKTVTQIQLHYAQNEKETTLIYEDNGIGIPQENKEKIFAEGFTTGGSGLGLKLVKKMIQTYGWTITEEGKPNKGTKFTITIPNQQHNHKQP